MPKVIFITGCSTGIGYDAALSLSRRGHQVIASCRKPADVDRLQELGISTVLMDVANPESVRSGFEAFLALTNGKIDVLINNAGYGQGGALEDVPHEALYDQFATNVFGLMGVTREVIPLMRAQQSGRIINISSVLGLVSFPFRGAYNASKYAVEGLSDTLRLELRSAGIQVITVEPGPIDSHFRENVIQQALPRIDVKHSVYKKHYQSMLTAYRQRKKDGLFTQPPSAVTRVLIQAIESEHPKAKYGVTIPTHLFRVLKRVLTVKMLDRVLLAISKKEMDA